MHKISISALVLLAGLIPAASPADGIGHSRKVTGPADEYVYELAEPGSYRLPVIRRAADAMLLDEHGGRVALHGIFKGEITVLAFIYTRCGDICPIASARMSDLQAIAAEAPGDAGDLTLVSLSFDPAYDTPGRLSEYARSFRSMDAPPWLFLTAPDQAAIAPVLGAYDQPVAGKGDDASAGEPFSHLLRVFLIDGDGMIRNIYSADFLDPRLVMNDVRTLRMEGAGATGGDRS